MEWYSDGTSVKIWMWKQMQNLLVSIKIFLNGTDSKITYDAQNADIDLTPLVLLIDKTSYEFNQWYYDRFLIFSIYTQARYPE